MPRNGNGVYALPGSDFVNGEIIDANEVNEKLLDIAQALTDSLDKDGQTEPTGNLPMGGFRLTGLGAGISSGDATNVGQVTGQIAAALVESGPLAGFRNLIINGNPTINQRAYVSGAATAIANQYTLDRWRVVTSGQSASWTDVAGIRSVTAPAGGMEQVVEGASILPGVYTLAWTGTASALVNGAAVANGGQVSLPGNTNATIRFSGGTFSLAQLEPGPLKTPFEMRPAGLELALCQRYFTRVSAVLNFSGYATGAGAGLYQYIYFPVAMRAAPAVSLNAGSGVNVTVAVGNVGTTGASIEGASVAAGLVAWQTTTSTTFSAEL